MQKPSYPVAVIMRRRPALSRWAEFVWEPWSVLTGYAGSPEARVLVEEDGVVQWLHPGFQLELHRDEAEGYYMNVSTASPRVFVLWRMDEERALPLQLTVSYDEAGRWLDAGHFVDSVPMPAEIFQWVGKYVEDNYRPEPRKRIKPRSFQHPKDRIS